MTDEAHFSPPQFLSYHAAQKGVTVADMAVPPTVVVSWHDGPLKQMREATGATLLEHWGGHQASIGGKTVAFCRVTIGAPATIVQIEELIAAGAQTIIGVGLAGSLQTRAPVGSLLLPTSCLVEEGTSAHYTDRLDNLAPDPALADALLSACRAEGVEPLTGKLWTIDAPYRETTRKVDTYREQGVLGVDMETSAMYALGAFRGVAVCNLLAVSDELWHEWRPAFGSPVLRAAQSQLAAAVLRALETL